MSGNFLFEVMLPLRVAAQLPGVVDVDVGVAGLAHAAGNHRIGHCAHGRVVNSAGELVPAIPAHRRRAHQAVVG